MAGLTAVANGLAYASWPAADAILLHAALDAVWTFAQPALVTYALLRHRLFDFEVRVKRTLRASTVAGAFAGLFVLGSEVARGLFPEASLLVGAAGALALVAAWGPLQRFADRVAERALPGVEPSADYLNLRKLDVYRAAMEEAARGGEVPGADEPRLAALRRELDLTERDHAVMGLALRHRGALPTPGLPLQPGEVILGRYVVERALGAGAHGAAYLAEDRARRERVVLKTLRPEIGRDPQALREARALRVLAHPRVVAFRELALEGPQPFLVMEHAAGGSLRDRLAHGPLPAEAFRTVALDLLEALQAVHEAGLVHRDVKPSNVLLMADGRAKLGDFGVAALPGLEPTAGGAADATGAVGTIRYMSPEAARGRRVTPRSDLYSAAATLYEAYTGRAYLEPGPGESAVEAQLRAAAARPFRARLEGRRPLRGWFARALDPDPARRFASAAEMRAALERALTPARSTGASGRAR